MTIFALTLLFIVAMILLGIPVAYTFGLGALSFAWISDRSLGYMLPQAFWQIGGFALLALPLFVLAGQLMKSSSVADRLLAFIEAIVGRVRGGLGAVTVLSCTVIGAISGSGSSAIAAVGSLMIDRMAERGYDRGYAVALVSCSSVLAQLIPPSIPMIVFSLMTGLPVTAAFLSTLLPGVMIAGLYCLINAYFAPESAASNDSRFDYKDYVENVGTTFSRAFWALMMPAIMLGGIYGGFFTPTEAAAVAVCYILLIGYFIYKGLNFSSIQYEVVESAKLTGSIVIILFALAIMSRGMVLEQIPGQVSTLLLGLTDNPWGLLLILNLVLLCIGMLVDDVSGSIVAAVVLYPVSQEMGLHPLHFAAIVGTNLGLGNVTPPCAPLLFMAGGVGKSKLEEYFLPTVKLLLLGHLPVLLAVTFIPELALLMPRLLLGIG